jgi:flagellar hook-length control protein FliK
LAIVEVTAEFSLAEPQGNDEIASLASDTTQPRGAPAVSGNDAQGQSRSLLSEAVRGDHEGAASKGGIGPADASRFVARVSRAVELAHERGQSLQIRLSPPELGSLRVEIAVRSGVLTAHLETETAAARIALLENLPALRERLAEHNVRVGQFDVDVRDESGGRFQEQAPSFDDHRRHAPQGLHRHDRDVRTTTESEPTRPRRLPSRSGGTRLNLVV